MGREQGVEASCDAGFPAFPTAAAVAWHILGRKEASVRCPAAGKSDGVGTACVSRLRLKLPCELQNPPLNLAGQHILGYLLFKKEKDILQNLLGK